MSREVNRDNRRFNWFKKCFPCFNPGEEQDDLISNSSDGMEEGDASKRTNLAVRSNDFAKLWTYCDIAKSGSMLYSSATSRAEPGPNSFCRISVEKLPSDGICVGLFDGHGSSDHCSIYANTHMLENMFDFTTSVTTIEDDLRMAFLRTDEQWLELVSKRFEDNRLIAAAGTSCLVAIFGGDHVYVASVGDSRAVMGTIDESDSIIPTALNSEDYVNDTAVREELQIQHPAEPDFIVEDGDGVYSIKGRSQVSKSLGDAFLKMNQFSLNEYPQYRLNTPITFSALSATPSTRTTMIHPTTDQFVIFGSKELWNIISNREAVLVVQLRKPRKRGMAALLIRYALNKVAKRHQMTYRQLQKTVSQGNGNTYYTDIGVVIVFLKETSPRTTTEEPYCCSTSTDYSTGLEDEDEGPDYFSGLEEFETEECDQEMPVEDTSPALPDC